MFGIDDPSALLRPWRNLQQFSEELYAMFSKGGTPEAGTPVSTRARPAPTETQRTRTIGGDQDVPSGGVRKARLDDARARVKLPDPASGNAHSAGGRATRPRGSGAHDSPRRTPGQTDPTPGTPTIGTQPPSRPSVETRVAAPAAPVQAEAPPRASRPVVSSGSQDVTPRRYDAPARDEPVAPTRRDRRLRGPIDIGEFANQVGGGGGGTTVFMGKVSSGSGSSYQVTLYPDGPSGTPDDTDVTVTVPMIDPGDQIPAGTWLSAVFQFSDSDGNPIYSCQPPVWIA